MNKTKHGTKIQWTHIPGYKGETWNVVSGCTHAGSPGCDACYAKRLFPRVYGKEKIKLTSTVPSDLSDTSTPATERKRRFSDIKLHHDRLRQPLSWAKPRAIFVCSMSDLFHPEVPFDFIDEVFLSMISSSTSIIGAPYGHIFLLLTKRPERMLEYYQRKEHKAGAHNFHGLMQEPGVSGIWAGVTVEYPDCLDRIDILRQIPVVHRFISFEPLLGSIPEVDLTGISQVIVGGESGYHPRYMDPDWARSLREQCKNAGVSYFMKQMSGKTKEERQAIPDDLMVREFPSKGERGWT